MFVVSMMPGRPSTTPADWLKLRRASLCPTKLAKYRRGEGRLGGGATIRTVSGSEDARELSTIVVSRRDGRAVREEAPEDTGGSVEAGDEGTVAEAGPRSAR